MNDVDFALVSFLLVKLSAELSIQSNPWPTSAGAYPHACPVRSSPTNATKSLLRSKASIKAPIKAPIKTSIEDSTKAQNPTKVTISDVPPKLSSTSSASSTSSSSFDIHFQDGGSGSKASFSATISTSIENENSSPTSIPTTQTTKKREIQSPNKNHDNNHDSYNKRKNTVLNKTENSDLFKHVFIDEETPEQEAVDGLYDELLDNHKRFHDEHQRSKQDFKENMKPTRVRQRGGKPRRASKDAHYPQYQQQRYPGETRQENKHNRSEHWQGYSIPNDISNTQSRSNPKTTRARKAESRDSSRKRKRKTFTEDDR